MDLGPGSEAVRQQGRVVSADRSVTCPCCGQTCRELHLSAKTAEAHAKETMRIAKARVDELESRQKEFDTMQKQVVDLEYLAQIGRRVLSDAMDQNAAARMALRTKPASRKASSEFRLAVVALYALGLSEKFDVVLSILLDELPRDGGTVWPAKVTS